MLSFFLSFWLISCKIFGFRSRIFLLGPSHHYYTPRCALSTATLYKTPIGDLPIDLEGIVNDSTIGLWKVLFFIQLLCRMAKKNRFL